MLRIAPDPPGLRLWDAGDHISKIHHGVKIDVLSDVNGSAELVFATHVVISSKGGSGTYIDQSKVPIEVHEPGYTTVFLPKGVKIAFEGTRSDCITVIRLPEGLFRRALRGVADYDACVFKIFRDDSDLVLMHATDLLRTIVLDDRPTPPDLIAPLLSSIITRVLQRVEGAPHKRTNAITDAHLALITRYIDARIMQPIRLPQLAEMMGLSVFHFSREFKIATNTSPMRYVLERRVHAAKQGLIKKQPLAEVALDAGFSSQSHFTTAFRLVTGQTPSAWRASQ